MSINALPYRPCAGLTIINQEGLAFAAKRIDSPSEAWQMPQGGIDEGETPQDAALRELTEETGITPDQVEILATMPNWLRYDLPAKLVPNLWNGNYRGQRQKWFALRFIGDDSVINIDQKNPEFSEWHWMHPNEIIANIVEFKREIYTQVLGSFAPFLAE